MSTLTVSQVPSVAVSRRSRSQLATKRVLVRLGQLFGRTAFTSRIAEIRLGLDFLYVSKKLSRMAARPYNYLVVVSKNSRQVRKNPKQIGGFENVYMISKHGWSKINYLKEQVRAPAKQTETLLGSMSKVAVLIRGTGDVFDFVRSSASRELIQDSTPALTSELARMLVLIDPKRGPTEAMLDQTGNLLMLETTATTDRALHLQKMGLIPQNIAIQPYVWYNKAEGFSEPTIMNALLLRGGIELYSKLAVQESKLESLEADHKIILEAYRSLLAGEKKRNEQLERENASLKWRATIRMTKVS